MPFLTCLLSETSGNAILLEKIELELVYVQINFQNKEYISFTVSSNKANL